MSLLNSALWSLHRNKTQCGQRIEALEVLETQSDSGALGATWKVEKDAAWLGGMEGHAA